MSSAWNRATADELDRELGMAPATRSSRAAGRSMLQVSLQLVILCTLQHSKALLVKSVHP
jgi:hypothetical protein